MRDSDVIEVDVKNRKLFFRGNCIEVLHSCSAACCRNDWRIDISMEEFQSGLYEAEAICRLTSKTCDKKKDPCREKAFRIRKRDDGACVYLNDRNLCTIYDHRPKVCQEFSCEGGWQFSLVFPVKANDPATTPGSDKEIFLSRLNDDLIFVPHPLLILHSIFFVREKKEIIFFKEIAGRCGKFYSKDVFDRDRLTDESVAALVTLFSNKRTLREVFILFCDQIAFSLTRREFDELIWLLNKHNIILEIGNFSGYLDGMGKL